MFNYFRNNLSFETKIKCLDTRFIGLYDNCDLAPTFAKMEIP